MTTPKENFILPHGNYQELLSYQKAEVVYDLTFRFCERFLKKGLQRNLWVRGAR